MRPKSQCQILLQLVSIVFTIKVSIQQVSGCWICTITLQGDRWTTRLGFGLSQSFFIEVGMFLSISQLGMSITEFSQVESSNLFSLLNLLFVRLDLRLQLVNHSLHTLLVLPVFISSISHFFNVSLSLSEILDSISKSAVLSSSFRFQLTDPCLLFIAFLPPFRALVSASSNRTWTSFT